ncbi:amidase [Pollutimonas harenae]|uniref:Amidase n=1 Tax=Pollutimonas harenae TaxID=657015 RepID=A0A853GPA4_9BURK|nr:amidase [Pollutimonas harenae]NYT84868.1 amidase [Pollutimonas harenae]TEA72734.1 amidase [Pollutimonas harenae]
MLPTLTELQTALNQGETTSVKLTQAALERIQSSEGEGARVYTNVYTEQALAAAQASDLLRAAGPARSPIDGLPISVKDLFDIAGDTTRAGSTVLNKAPAATQHALIVQRLIGAGAVIIGKTNMTEFAFSGLGLNPHYGTPTSPWDRASKRIPGGSSSGAGVSVADQMAVAAIGTDTGGSVRIPSAFCGLTGFKPTARRVPQTGALPLSFSLDSIGPLAASVSCCAILDAILAGQPYMAPVAPSLKQLRFAVPSTVVLDGADDHVRSTFEQALATLQAGGAQVDVIELPEFQELATINRQGGLVCAEAWAWHEKLLEQHADQYDPRVASRIERGKNITAPGYIELLQTRKTWITSVQQRLHHYDALLMPTVPVVAPTIRELQDSDDHYFATNGLILRNSTIINFFDGCALSIPCHPSDTAPVGLMVAGPAMNDQHILNIGASIEAALG